LIGLPKSSFGKHKLLHTTIKFCISRRQLTSVLNVRALVPCHRNIQAVSKTVGMQSSPIEPCRSHAVHCCEKNVALWTPPLSYIGRKRHGNACPHRPQTKIWDGRTYLSECVFEALFKGVSTVCGLRIVEKGFEDIYWDVVFEITRYDDSMMRIVSEAEQRITLSNASLVLNPKGRACRSHLTSHDATMKSSECL
jgi:hypothetical protein